MKRAGGSVNALGLLFALRDGSGRDMKADVVPTVHRLARERNVECADTMEAVRRLSEALGGPERLRAAVLRALADPASVGAPGAAPAAAAGEGRLL